MPQESVELVRGLYDAYRRKDIAAIFAALAPSVELYQSELLPWGGRYQGHEGARAFFGKLVEHIDSRVDVERLIPAGDHVVAVGYSRGTVERSGRPFEVPAVHVWAVRGGAVQTFEAYLDTPAMLAALQ